MGVMLPTFYTTRCQACGASIRAHSGATTIACTCGHRATAAAAAARAVVGWRGPPPARNRNAWRALHRYPHKVAQWCSWEAAKWYSATWLPTIPAAGCQCATEWGKLQAKLPPDFNSAQAFSRWAHKAHNRVRARLGQLPIDWAASQAAATRPTVGFASCAYMPHGGTETFHRTLLPALQASGRVWVDGFAVTAEEHAGGDPALLGVPSFGMGMAQAQLLAARVDVLVYWAVAGVADILPEPPPYTLAVHHSDRSSTWSTDGVLANAAATRAVVCVNPDVATMDFQGPATVCIPNAVDPARCTGSPTGLLAAHGIAPGTTVHLWCHRWATEKRPELALQIAQALPPGHVLVLAGGPVPAALGPLPAQARVVGPVATPGPWLQLASTFLSTTVFEGHGCSVAEAMWAGVPVVSTPTGIAAQRGLAYHVKHNAGAKAWARTLVAAATGRATVAAAQAHVQANYAPGPWLARWEALLLAAAGQDW